MARSKTYQMLMKISGDSSSLKKACEAASEHLDTLGNAAKAAGKVAATALAGIGTAAAGIAGMEGVVIFSLGSDGTDGPTDAAGGYVDGGTRDRLRALGIEVPAVLAENDSYHALKKIGGLIVTGPTGTNVNDLSVGLYRPPAMP